MMMTILPLRVMSLPVSGHGVCCPEVGGADVVVRFEALGTDEVVGVVGAGDTGRGGEMGLD